MLVSTKGRYALRLMVAWRRRDAEGKVALREVSEREDISLKYLEQLARPLVQAGCSRACAARAAATRWPGAGDRCVRATCCAPSRAPRPPWRASTWSSRAWPARARECTTVRFWAGLDEVIERYVDGVTLAELARVPEIDLSID